MAVKAAATSKHAWEDIGKLLVHSALDAIVAVLNAYAAKETTEAIAAMETEDEKGAAEHYLAAAEYGAGAGVIKGIEAAWLADGGVATKPTLAMIGEGGEPEAVVPLSKAGDMGFGGGPVTVHAPINLPNVKKPSDFAKPESQRTISRVLATQLMKLQGRQGLRFAQGIASAS